MAIIRSKIARQLLAEGGAPRRKGFMFGSPGSKEQQASFGAQAAMDIDEYSGLDNEEQQAIDQARFDAGIRSPEYTNMGISDDATERNFFQKTIDKISPFTPIGLLSRFDERFLKPGRDKYNLARRTEFLKRAGIIGPGEEDEKYSDSFLLSPEGLNMLRGMGYTTIQDVINKNKDEGGDNEPIKRLRAPITEKKEEPKSEFDDILKFYGARFAKGGDVDYADQDLEEQAAIDAGEATAQMTTQERDEQGYGGGSADDLPTLPETGPIVFGGGPTTNVSGFGLLGRPTPTISKTTQDKITRDILTEEDDIPFGLDALKQGAFNVGKTISAEGSLYDKALTGPYGAGAVQKEQSLRERFGIGKADGGAIRQNYGLGSIVKKATRAVKKVAKSPLGKAAIFAGLGAYGLGAGPFASGGAFAKAKGAGFLKNFLLKDAAAGFALDNISPFGAITTASLLAGALSKQDEEDEKLPTVTNTDPEITKFIDFYGGPRRFARSGGIMTMLGKAGSAAKNLKKMVVTKLGRMTDDVELRGSSDYAEDTGASFELTVTAKSKKGKKTLDSLVEEGVVEKLDDNTYFISDANYDSISGMKGLKASGIIEEGGKFKRFDEGAGMGEYDMPYYGYDEVIDTFGRKKKAKGGVMEQDEMLDLGGNEMDLRGGGFVPLGEYEKKDDVPARLSKNEFVFTADAVRAAGGGSVDKGADVMYKTMKTLENKVA